MTVESVTQAVSNLALQFGDDKAEPGAMVSPVYFAFLYSTDKGYPKVFTKIISELSSKSNFT